jgi:hypothetical protein
MPKSPSGMIIYRGPSMLDGAPIVVIATGLKANSQNAKTGHMVQTFILREDVNPFLAIKSGDDISICGDCKHRPANGGACYVRVEQAPNSVWRAYKRGAYPDYSSILRGAQRVAGLNVRLGTYGDPAAVPFAVWENLTQYAAGVTGYTHQWRNFPALAALCMASVDSFDEFMAAKAQGWRTFRVRTASEYLAPREVICPASKEAGTKTNCAACKACGGHAAKAKADIAIIAHGGKASRFTKQKELAE